MSLTTDVTDVKRKIDVTPSDNHRMLLVVNVILSAANKVNIIRYQCLLLNRFIPCLCGSPL